MSEPPPSSQSARWDERFSGEDYVFGTAPNAWLERQAWRLARGMSALAVADGEGRNGVWLATQGLAVTSVDASARGLEKARALAAAKGVEIETIHADLALWDWPRAAFDVVVSIFLHMPVEMSRPVHRRMIEALKPGGLILLEAYNPYQLLHRTGGPPDLGLLYTADRLRREFEGTEIMLLEEIEREIAEGIGHRGRSAVVDLVARRP